MTASLVPPHASGDAMHLLKLSYGRFGGPLAVLGLVALATGRFSTLPPLVRVGLFGAGGGLLLGLGFVGVVLSAPTPLPARTAAGIALVGGLTALLLLKVNLAVALLLGLTSGIVAVRAGLRSRRIRVDGPPNPSVSGPDANP